MNEKNSTNKKKHGDKTNIHLDFQKSSIQLCGIEKYNTYFIPISCTIYTVSLFFFSAGERRTQGPSSTRCSTLKQRILTKEDRGFFRPLKSPRLQLQLLFKNQTKKSMMSTAWTKCWLWCQKPHLLRGPWRLNCGREGWVGNFDSLLCTKGSKWDIMQSYRSKISFMGVSATMGRSDCSVITNYNKAELNIEKKIYKNTSYRS